MCCGCGGRVCSTTPVADAQGTFLNAGAPGVLTSCPRLVAPSSIRPVSGFGRARTARTVDGHHCRPPCEVLARSALSPRAISPRLLPFTCSAWILATSSGWNARLAAGTCRRFGFRARVLHSLGQVALEFGDWDQSSAPLRRDRATGMSSVSRGMHSNAVPHRSTRFPRVSRPQPDLSTRRPRQPM